ncbi:hypothetical protein LEM8419_00127 [Neolewinella maritima]|uniref:Outer membrane protein beta-barrel domain-containing protein n=1 Tax=Neolewinella maritima TaxID=1383882 RepID=A0ABM9AWN1_9BACT|nr:hypothetical protein [Neolewinella maritima]CAH0998794.1 hypothetical protein LEM8419_00127 [Neolewinella maritima]
MRIFSLLVILFPFLLQAQSTESGRERRWSVGPLIGMEHMWFKTYDDVNASRQLIGSSTRAVVYGLTARYDYPSRVDIFGDLAYHSFDFSTTIDLFEIGSKTVRRRMYYDQQAINLNLGLRYDFTVGHTVVFGEGAMFMNHPIRSTFGRSTLVEDTETFDLKREIVGADYGALLGLGLSVGAVELRTRLTLTDRTIDELPFTSRRLGAFITYWL